MAKARTGLAVAAGCLLLWGAATPAGAAAPTVSQMLSWYKPKQEGIAYTTPAPEDQRACKVQPVAGSRPGSVNGWQLVDGQGKLLRRFYDSNGDQKRPEEKKINVWSYYRDGVEVYRETDAAGGGTPNQFRWLNAGGSRWGVDVNGDGKIDTWRLISAEEACRELFLALATNDAQRFKALLLTEEEMRALKLPAAEVERLQGQLGKAAAKFQSLAAKIPAKAQFGGVEGAAPQCVPADQLGTAYDLFKFPSRTVRYDYGERQHDWLQTGEMVRVGLAWRLADGPVPGGDVTEADGTAGPAKSGVNPELEKLLKELADLDARAPQPAPTPGPNAPLRDYNLRRADLIGRILAKVKADEREQWVRQLADCLAAAAQNSPESDRSSLERLAQLKAQAIAERPKSALAAYVTFRGLWAEYSPKLAQGGKRFAGIQKEWLGHLKQFVQDYPDAEDTPDALLQLGMGSEFNGKDGEARKWYQQLAKNFAGHPLAAKAKGAVARLGLEGKELKLSGPTLAGGAFDLASLHGKVVVVYYWASYGQQCPGDFAKLKALLGSLGSKGVAVVCVNLDEDRKDAEEFLKGRSLEAPQLYQAGGLNSPLAVQYGIMGLPNLFLVGKDGKVVNRTVQINDLEDEVKRLVK